MILHERLAIVDPVHGAQPLVSPDTKHILCVNGEIHNHRQLRSGLVQPFEFATDSDCEVILALYAENPEDPALFLNQLNGIWAFVLYDETRDRYLVARDHMGIVPLYIGWTVDGSVWIASELKALTTECVRFEEFPPGCFYFSTQREQEQERRQRWYSPPWHVPDFIPHTSVDLSELRCQFESAVVRQLMCDVPYGVLLSGGE